MNESERQRRVYELYAELIELPAAVRPAALADRCDDQQVRDDVAELLALEAQSAAPIDGLLATGATAGSDFPIVAGLTVRREIGDGASGRVFQAVDQQSQQQVALKVLRHLDGDTDAQERFAREAEVLRRLDHPGIAGFLRTAAARTAVGETQSLVMQYVDGQPITSYCDAFDVDDRSRIALVADICDAVQHAHERGVVHRDLKPANILVSASGHATVVDFGVASVAGVPELETLARTREGDLLGTLAYMSPEQASSGEGEIDGRADVYSLGVLLFQLLTGRLPLRLAGASLTEALRIIASEPPTDLPEARPEHTGDLATIVGRALAKDRVSRYASAANLGADLRRYLARETIVARPPGTLEQLTRFSRRNRGFVIAVGAILMALVIAVVGLSSGLSAAERATAEADEISAALLDMVAAPSIEAHGYNVRVATILDGLAAKIDHMQDLSPRRAASLHRRLAETYDSLGEHAKALRHYGQALTRSDVLSKLEHAEIQVAKATTHLNLQQSQVAMPLLHEARQRFEDLYGAHCPDVWLVDTKIARTLVQQSKFQDAQKLAGLAETNLVACAEASPLDPLRPANVAALALMNDGKIADALVRQRANLARFDATGLEDVRLRNELERNLGWLLRRNGLVAEAVAHYEAAYERILALRGKDHPLTWGAQEGFAVALKNDNQLARAIPLLKGAVDGYETRYGPDHSETITAQWNLAQAQFDVGQKDDALAFSTKLAESILARGPRSKPDYTAFNTHAAFLRATDPEQASIWMKRALTLAEQLHAADDPELLQLKINYAQVLSQCRRIPEALEKYEEILAQIENTPRERRNPKSECTARTNHAALVARRDGAATAVPLYERAAELATRAYAVGDFHRGSIIGLFGQTLIAAGQPERAKKVLLEARENFEACQQPVENQLKRITQLLAIISESKK